MKSINILKNLINILFWGMIVFAVLVLIGVSTLFISPESLPLMFKGYAMLLDFNYPWQILIVPFFDIVGFVLFIVSIYFLKKCIKPFQQRQFYSSEVIKNLQKAGRLFIIIALVTSVIRLIAALTFNTYANFSVIGGNFGSGSAFTAVTSAIENINFFLLIIGLFLLVFSKAFENGKLLKQENDLTI